MLQESLPFLMPPSACPWFSKVHGFISWSFVGQIAGMGLSSTVCIFRYAPVISLQCSPEGNRCSWKDLVPKGWPQ